jgi:hypothetical protein
VGLELRPLSLVSKTEELLERKRSGSGLESREYGRRGSAALTAQHPLFAKVGTTFAARSVYFASGLKTRCVCLRACLSPPPHQLLNGYIYIYIYIYIYVIVPEPF